MCGGKKKKRKRMIRQMLNWNTDLTNGWVDSEIQNPKKSGQYLCLLKWDDDEYVYQILDYNAENDNWSVTDSCEHIIWSELRKKPNV